MRVGKYVRGVWRLMLMFRDLRAVAQVLILSSCVSEFQNRNEG